MVIDSRKTVTWAGNTKVAPTSTLAKEFLRILVPISAPFSFLKNGLPDNTTSQIIHGIPSNEFQGVAVDLLRTVAERAGFNYTFSVWRSSWNDMVKVVGDTGSPYDMAISSITVNADRSKNCNFSRSIYLSGLLILVPRKVAASTQYWIFFQGLEWKIWLMLLVTFISVAIVFMILDPSSFRSDPPGPHAHRERVSNSLFFSFSAFFFVHEGDEIRKPWSRVFLTVVLFEILIITAAYTANLVYLLSNRQASSGFVKDFPDLPAVQVGCRYGGTSWKYVTESLGLRKLTRVSGADEAVECLRNGSIKAYVADIPHLKKIASVSCDLVITGQRVRCSTLIFWC